MTTPAGYIQPADLKQLSKLKPWRTALALAVDWVILIGAICFGVWTDSWLAYFPVIAIVAARQHAIAVIMHDMAHYRFIKNKVVSDWIADLTIAWPLLATYDGYRRNHLGHHRYLNTDKDPDWAAKLGKIEFTFPQELRFAIFNLIGYLVCVSSVRDLLNIHSRISKDDLSSRNYKILRISYYAVFAAIFTYFEMWTIFLVYYMVPYLTLFLMFNYIRSVADHFGETMDYSHELGGARTILASPFETFFLAPHNINYHGEHHSYPSVPYYNLPELHDVLMANPDYAEHVHITRGFVKGLWDEIVLTGARAAKKAKEQNSGSLDAAE